MKKSIAMFVVCVFAIILVSCGHEYDICAKVKKKYSDIQSYRANLAVTVKFGGGESFYTVRQVYSAPNKVAVTVTSPEEISGYGVVIDGEYAVLKSGFGQSESLEGISAEKMSDLLLMNIFERYFESGNAPYETIVDACSSMLLCCETEHDGAVVRLYLDKETYMPFRLEICGEDAPTTVTIEYREFELNCETDEKDFE